jgi:hypothetical protein
MGKFKKIKNAPEKKRISISPEKKRLLITVAINSVLLTLIYFVIAYGINLGLISLFLPVLYWIVLAGFIMAYIIYNRAFTRRDLTPDMLPLDWTLEQKEEYIADGKNRLKKSQWMLTLIIPIAVPVALDALYSFTFPMIQNLFGIN